MLFPLTIRPINKANSVSHEINPSINITSRTMSVDNTSETNSKRSLTDGMSASSSEHDNQETNAWSSDCSNSDDEGTFGEGIAVPVSVMIHDDELEINEKDLCTQ